MARPSARTPELVDEIVARLSGRNGMPEDMAAICRDAHMPHPTTIRDWRKSDKDLDQLLSEAWRDGDDVLEKIQEQICSTPEMGVIEEYERVPKPRPPGASPDTPIEYEMVLVKSRREDMLGHRKLKAWQIDQRLSRRRPASMKIEHSGRIDTSKPERELTDEQLETVIAAATPPSASPNG